MNPHILLSVLLALSGQMTADPADPIVTPLSQTRTVESFASAYDQLDEGDRTASDYDAASDLEQYCGVASSEVYEGPWSGTGGADQCSEVTESSFLLSGSAGASKFGAGSDASGFGRAYCSFTFRLEERADYTLHLDLTANGCGRIDVRLAREDGGFGWSRTVTGGDDEVATYEGELGAGEYEVRVTASATADSSQQSQSCTADFSLTWEFGSHKVKVEPASLSRLKTSYE